MMIRNLELRLLNRSELFTLVWPHPENVAATAPVLLVARVIGCTETLNVIIPVVWTVLTSLAMLNWSKSGWFRIAIAWNRVPPVERSLLPTRTRVFEGVRLIVQWAAEPTQRLLIIKAPQKCTLAFDCKEAWCGNWLADAWVPPTIRPSHPANGISFNSWRAIWLNKKRKWNYENRCRRH